MSKAEYADGTFALHRDAPFGGEMIGGRAMCPDGVLRNLHPTTDGVADTFFSVPMFVYCKGKRVYGYATVQTRAGYSTSRASDPFTLKFRAYTYRKHFRLVGPSGLVSDREMEENGGRMRDGD